MRRLPPEERTLARFLAETDLSLEDVYRSRGWTWTGLLRAAGHPVPPEGPSETDLSRGLRRLLHLDDPEWLACLRAVLAQPAPPDPGALPARQVRILTALHFALSSDVAARKRPVQGSLEALWQHPAIRQELVELLTVLEDRASLVPVPLAEALGVDHPAPLAVHSTYRLDDILSAFSLLTPERPHRIREGVKFDPATRTDLFFITLEKAEKHYSPTTRYRDYALSPDLFHWESQSTTTVASKTGQRYIKHRARGTHILLFVRQSRKDSGHTQPYVFLGPADYEAHSGERPIAITWRLRVPMPPELLQRAKVASG